MYTNTDQMFLKQVKLGLTTLLRTFRRMSPDTAYALSPNVLSVRGRRVHVQVADVWLLGVGFETTSDPEGLGAG